MYSLFRRQIQRFQNSWKVISPSYLVSRLACPSRVTRRRASPSPTRQLLLVAALLASPGHAGDDDLLAHWTIERAVRAAPLAAGQTLRLDNPHGDLRLRDGGEEQDGGEVEVRAVIQHHEDDPLIFALALLETADGLELEARWTPRADAPKTPPPADILERRRVDLVIFVPKGVRVEARTTTGLLEAKGLAVDITATSQRGAIRLATDGHPRATNVHGEILVRLPPTPWPEPVELETTNGAITVFLPAAADAADIDIDVDAATGGLFTTDYSATVEPPDPRSGVKAIRARVGEAGEGRSVLRLRSVNGNLALRRGG